MKGLLRDAARWLRFLVEVRSDATLSMSYRRWSALLNKLTRWRRVQSSRFAEAIREPPLRHQVKLKPRAVAKQVSFNTILLRCDVMQFSGFDLH